MEIELRTILSEGAEDTALFSLSGYYTDYIDFSVTEPEAYVSKAFLEQQEIPVFPADKIMAVTGSLQDERGIETKLYSDLTMEYAAQQVSAENPMVKTKCGRRIRECLYCMLDALPTVLQKLFMQGLGESDVTGFYPVFMAGSRNPNVCNVIFCNRTCTSTGYKMECN